MRRASDFAFAIIVFSVFAISPAQAYLDSGTISLILQMVTGAVASALLFGKLYVARIMSFFRRSPPSAPSAGDSREG